MHMEYLWLIGFCRVEPETREKLEVPTQKCGKVRYSLPPGDHGRIEHLADIHLLGPCYLDEIGYLQRPHVCQVSTLFTLQS